MLTGLKGLPHSLEAPHYRGGEPVGLSNMVQFPAGSANSHMINTIIKILR